MWLSKLDLYYSISDNYLYQKHDKRKKKSLFGNNTKKIQNYKFATTELYS